jgi:methylated-DNA-protein-cysteine methyltransferase-like protein
VPAGNEDIYAVVRQIPRGRVATYGQIAHLVGPSCDARRVGWALAALTETRIDPVPWQRVVNAKGMSSLGGEQVALLKQEGVAFDARGRIDLRRFGWNGLSEDGSQQPETYSLFA